MIRIERLHITRFRGILDLELNINQRNFAVSGPNGTGKSGVVDAIEFAVSGDISRLSGKGTGGVSVKAHAPHVDFRDQPDDAMVEMEGVIVATSKKFKITRSVGNPKSPAIEPYTADVVEAVGDLGRHKNATLSRRELIQYILSTPGDRAAEINALLQLHQLRDLRSTLQKIANSCERELQAAKFASTNASESLATALSIPTLKSSDLLAAVNQRRKTLDLPEIKEFEATTLVKDGLTVAAEKSGSGISKSVAVAEVEKLIAELEKLPQSTGKGIAAAIIERLEKLSENKDFMSGVNRHNLLDKALALVEDDQCPVCETQWKTQDLIELIGTRLKELKSFIAEKQDIQQAIEPVTGKLRAMETSLKAAAAYGKKLKPEVQVEALTSFSTTLSGYTKLIDDFSTPEDVISSLKSAHEVPIELKNQVVQLLTAIKALPETAARDTARDFLVAVSERLEVYRQARRLEAKAKQEHELSATVFAIYSSSYEKGLNNIYADIQDLFAELYRQVNQEDEGGFKALMAAEKSSLDLKVDFYGRGKFPPGAYHSEGHQDGMGLCLYLALMQHLYGDCFRFCVLDDVLMSVDSGHRRAVCKMLSERFPSVQFIFTTHDEVWLKNMQSTGLIQSGDCIQFRNWSVEAGPAEWIADDIWQEVINEIERNDIKAASATLRHYLEFLVGQLCHNLRALVVYRGDNRHSLANLLPQALSCLKKTIKEAKDVARSWGNNTEYQRLEALQKKFEHAVADSNAEQWALNAKVHYNEWANLTQDEFRTVAESYKALMPFLQCSNCNGLLYVTPEIGVKEALRCGCGQVNCNLKKKA